PDLRPMLDIDVLIDRSDRVAAAAICRELGYDFASRHPSMFMGRMHHLPVAQLSHAGFDIFLEIHTDATSPSYRHRLTTADLSTDPVAFSRGSRPEGLALGHTDMLRHLVRHAFEPARQVRLIHLYDIWRYRTIFADEIDWPEIADRFPFVPIALQ